jgi:hypothetical protein
MTHIKLVFYLFEAMSGLKTNFMKSEVLIVLYGVDQSLSWLTFREMANQISPHPCLWLQITCIGMDPLFEK